MFSVVLGILFIVSLYGNYYLYMKLKEAKSGIDQITAALKVASGAAPAATVAPSGAA